MTIEQKFVGITGLNSSLTRIFVDTRAASQIADGSAMRPFRTIQQALTLCPSEFEDMEETLRELKVIMPAGKFENVNVNRACMLQGFFIASGLTLSAPYNILAMAHLEDLTIAGAGFFGVLDAVIINADVEKSGMFLNCEFWGGITLPEEGEVLFRNCQVNCEVTVPAGCQAVAVNSYFGDNVTGSLTLLNSAKAD